MKLTCIIIIDTVWYTVSTDFIKGKMLCRQGGTTCVDPRLPKSKQQTLDTSPSSQNVQVWMQNKMVKKLVNSHHKFILSVVPGKKKETWQGKIATLIQGEQQLLMIYGAKFG